MSANPPSQPRRPRSALDRPPWPTRAARARTWLPVACRVVSVLLLAGSTAALAQQAQPRGGASAQPPADTDPAMVKRPPARVDPEVLQSPPPVGDPDILKRPPDVAEPPVANPDTRRQGAPGQPSREDDCRGSAALCRGDSAR